MALTIKDLGEQFEALDERLGAAAEAVTAKLDTLAKNQGEAAVAAATVKADVESLKKTIDNASLNSLHADVVAVKTTVGNAKLVGVAATLVAAFLGGAGIWKIINTQVEMQSQQAQFTKLSAQASELIVQHAQMMKEALIEKIENDLNSEASLDALKGSRQFDRIQTNAAELESLNASLPTTKRSDYFLVGKALAAFLNDTCDDALKILDQIGAKDSGYYGIWYLRGACYSRVGRPDMARQAFATASKLTYEGKRVQMTMNAEAYSSLQLWKTMRLAKPAEASDSLNESIQQLEHLIKTYPGYVSAYVNLACAYSAKRDFGSVSRVLAELRALISPEKIAQYVYDDMNRPSEEYLNEYVKDYLGLKSSTSDPHWKQDLILKLPPPKLDQN